MDDVKLAIFVALITVGVEIVIEDSGNYWSTFKQK